MILDNFISYSQTDKRKLASIAIASWPCSPFGGELEIVF